MQDRAESVAGGDIVYRHRRATRLWHSLHARPLVVPRGLAVTVRNVTLDVACTVLVDGHRVAGIEPGGEVSISLSEQRSLLATLPETTFFSRYGETFSS